MLPGECRGAFQLPTVIQDLIEIERGDGFAFHTQPRSRNTGLLLQHTLRRATDQSRRQNARFVSFQNPSTMPIVSPASLTATPPMFACESLGALILNRATSPDGAVITSLYATFNRAHASVKTAAQHRSRPCPLHRLWTKQQNCLTSIHWLRL